MAKRINIGNDVIIDNGLVGLHRCFTTAFRASGTQYLAEFPIALKDASKFVISISSVYVYDGNGNVTDITSSCSLFELLGKKDTITINVPQSAVGKVVRADINIT